MLKYYNSEKIEVGIDEAGRGCLAGPVFTGAVILPKEFEEEDEDLISQIRDSKKLSRKKRALLRQFIESIAIDFSVTFKDHDYIDKNNILKSKAIKQFINSTEFVSELYGDYEYYTLLSPFLNQLFISDDNEFARDLYIKISSQFKERLTIIMSMQSDEKAEYSQSILNDYFELRSLVEIILKYDAKKEYVIE